MTPPALTFERARSEQLARLDEIRRAAFAPVFASFRAILGNEIYARAQAPEDAMQGSYLAECLEQDSVWEVYAARLDGDIVGFVSLRLDAANAVGEIGLNAVHPDHTGQGIGTAMYDYALARMREVGMRVATVATGGDPSHASARRAYRKAGFDVEITGVWMCREL